MPQPSNLSDPFASETPATESLSSRFQRVRATTMTLIDTLEAEDTVVQSMPDVSPTRWHLAHTSWFFERFVLLAHQPSYPVYDDNFDYMFNSYYFTVGQMHRRAERGLLSRPTLADIVRFREHVDRHMVELLTDRNDEQLTFLVVLGLNHEQQHQELMLTDIKHVFFQNPLEPVFRDVNFPEVGESACTEFVDFDGGVVEAGATGEGFSFDNETPRHQILLRPYRLGKQPVSNAAYREFIRDDGYHKPELWLSDGWTVVQSEGWRHPLYWCDELQTEFTLAGRRELQPQAPVCHLSLYEADAFARWAGARLPTEFEWEHAAPATVSGNLLDNRVLHPLGATPQDQLQQMYGDVWEWTASPYAAYPGYKPLAGSLGEYNGKFMCNQVVLRGGSCVTPADHIRASYRNFFYPHQRWQFSGLRLAQDAA